MRLSLRIWVKNLNRLAERSTDVCMYSPGRVYKLLHVAYRSQPLLNTELKHSLFIGPTAVQNLSATLAIPTSLVLWPETGTRTWEHFEI